MKQHSKWIAPSLAVVAGLAVVGSAHAQGVNLSTVAPASVNAYYSAWAGAPTVTTSTPTGLEIASQGYGSLYYATVPAQQTALNPADSQVTLTFTVNSPSTAYYVGVPFVLDDNGGSVTYGGYATYGPGTYSETVPLTPAQQATVAAGGDVITGFNLEFDPTVIPGGYDITFNSLSLSPVPEPTTLSLAGLGAAGLLAFRRWKK